MAKKYEYYYPSIPKKLEKEIDILFETNEKVHNFYDNNKVKFIEDWIRRGILYFEDLKLEQSKIKTRLVELDDSESLES